MYFSYSYFKDICFPKLSYYQMWCLAMNRISKYIGG